MKDGKVQLEGVYVLMAMVETKLEPVSDSALKHMKFGLQIGAFVLMGLWEILIQAFAKKMIVDRTNVKSMEDANPPRIIVKTEQYLTHQRINALAIYLSYGFMDHVKPLEVVLLILTGMESNVPVILDMFK